MGANQRFESWTDWSRRNYNVAPRCGVCGHNGSVNPDELFKWAIVWRWHAVASMNLRKFKCSRCGGRADRLAATLAPPSVPDWGPSEAEWKRLKDRMRG